MKTTFDMGFYTHRSADLLFLNASGNKTRTHSENLEICLSFKQLIIPGNRSVRLANCTFTRFIVNV